MASSPPCSAFGIRGLFNRQIFLGELDFSVAGFVLLDFLLNERFDHIGHGTVFYFGNFLDFCVVNRAKPEEKLVFVEN